MILGLLSDSHGRHERTAAALRLLRDHGAAAFIHCGDIGDERVLDVLAEYAVQFVWGNNDQPDASLLRYCRALGLNPTAEPPLRVEHDGRRLCVFHGHEPLFWRVVRILERGQPAPLHEVLGPVDYVLYGHTHVASDARLGDVRLINPGALTRAAEYTVATLDLACDALRFLTVD
ncbi:MAG TPA: metallophosphoesterase family protein [Phycisphaerae bacterium]|nr:metallophosphoesterase family protein [Phycisphaerae bacterium]